MTGAIAERKLAIAVEALRKIQDRGRAYECDYEDATAAFSQIATLDAPPQPDLTGIGGRAYAEARDREHSHTESIVAAYAAMRAADPKVRGLRNAIIGYLNANAAYSGDVRGADKYLRAALAALDAEDRG